MSASSATAVVGELRWNIKQSFRDYVAELPDGKETWTGTSGGFDGTDLVFPAVERVEAGDAFTLRFEGGVRYQGHRGMLRVDVSDPWIEVDEAGHTTLTANVAPEGRSAHRAAIVLFEGTPTTSAHECTWSPGHSRLTIAGAALLGSVYEPGSEADGLSLRVVEA